MPSLRIVNLLPVFPLCACIVERNKGLHWRRLTVRYVLYREFSVLSGSLQSVFSNRNSMVKMNVTLNYTSISAADAKPHVLIIPYNIKNRMPLGVLID